MAKKPGDVLKSLDFSKITVGKDGRLKIAGEDLLQRLRAEGVALSDTDPSSNRFSCNSHHCQ
jgi:hypothetical protein